LQADLSYLAPTEGRFVAKPLHCRALQWYFYRSLVFVDKSSL
jgi:hypothetical protein